MTANGGLSTYDSNLVFPTIMNWHVACLSGVFVVTCQLIHKVLELKPTLQEDAVFSVLSGDDIVSGQSGCGSDHESLFTVRDLTL